MSLPPVIDCHAHLCDPVFDPDRREVLGRARAAGVRAVVAVGETLEGARRNRELEKWIRENRTCLVAVGEVGLDHWKVKEPEDREIQREIFRRFIRLSTELDLPLNVHSRSAGRHAIAELKEISEVEVAERAHDNTQRLFGDRLTEPPSS